MVGEKVFGLLIVSDREEHVGKHLASCYLSIVPLREVANVHEQVTHGDVVRRDLPTRPMPDVETHLIRALSLQHYTRSLLRLYKVRVQKTQNKGHTAHLPSRHAS